MARRIDEPGVAALLAALLAGGCMHEAGTLPRVSTNPPEAGYKMLKPAARAEVCDGMFFPSLRAGASDPLDRAFRALLARDEEATAVVNARIEWTGWSIGIYGRRCVALEGDVVRSAATVLLPMAGHHGAP